MSRHRMWNTQLFRGPRCLSRVWATATDEPVARKNKGGPFADTFFWRASFFGRRIFWRGFRVAGGGVLEIGMDRGFCVADGPADSSSQQIQMERILPVFRAVADGSVENSSFAIHPGPDHGIRSTVVCVAVHRGSVQRADDMKVWREVFHRIPLVHQTE